MFFPTDTDLVRRNNPPEERADGRGADNVGVEVDDRLVALDPRKLLYFVLRLDKLRSVGGDLLDHVQSFMEAFRYDIFDIVTIGQDTDIAVVLADRFEGAEA